MIRSFCLWSGWSQPKIRWKSLFVATVGSNITIPCHKDVSFMGKVYWMSGTNIVYNYLSGNPLPPHLRVYAQYTSLSSIDLKIQQARYSDTGTYTCVLNSIQHPQTTIRQVEVSVLTSKRKTRLTSNLFLVLATLELELQICISVC